MSTWSVRSGSSECTASPSLPLARSPGSPASVWMGILCSRDSSASNSAGSVTMGSMRGRNPRVVDTMNAGSVVSSGLVSSRTSKEDGGGRVSVVMVEVE